jgi:hypothetical protein
MSRGLFPTKNILSKYPLLLSTYGPLIKAIRRCDLAAFRALTGADSRLGREFFILMRRIELLIFRGIVKQIFSVTGQKRRIDMSVLADVGTGGSITVAEDVAASLIMEGLISGYMSYEEHALMLTGSNPFPAPF